MSAIIFAILLLAIFGKSKRDNRRSPLFGFIIAGIVISMGLSVILPWLFALGAAGLLGFGIFQLVKYNKSKQQKKEYGWDASKVNQTARKAPEYQQYVKNPKTTLPKPVAKRKRICENFNEKYNLYLTEAQMQSIVNSSYMSEIWRKELESMNRKYESVYEWFTGYTRWLRVYLFAFHVQEVTSDIRQQENIVTYTFEEVFKYVDTLPDMPLSEKIARVNDKFYAAFDDVSFMIAYRYLEEKGMKHSLEGATVIKEDEEIDELLKKYEPKTTQQQ
ncbi:MAG: hypothetical protein KBS85_05425 [Lachnospiraceae bacterium]|nr:hypothetical protein [Candidatus Merdinaster equi]